MKIVVLDGYTLNPGDLDWSDLERLGECRIYDHSQPDQVLERAAGAEAVLTNKTVLTADQIRRLDNLRYIGVLATGFNIVNLDAARERNVPVTNVPAYGTASVAQMTFALLLELTQRVGHHSATVHEGRWNDCRDFCYWDVPLVELDGLKMGVIGFGRIGQAVGRIARAFGMDVLAVSPSNKEVDYPVQFTNLDALLTEADVVSLHCPLTPDTERLISTKRLHRMKPSSFLINTSRGPLIDEAALENALRQGEIAGAALDVLTTEPPRNGSPLLGAPNVFITPHIAWATRSARRRLLATAVENVRAFLSGQPRNVVNGV